METRTRFIIDYTDGGVWEMPAELFERYEAYNQNLRRKAISDVYQASVREQWYDSLSAEEKALVVKKRSW